MEKQYLKALGSMQELATSSSRQYFLLFSFGMQLTGLYNYKSRQMVITKGKKFEKKRKGQQNKTRKRITSEYFTILHTFSYPSKRYPSYSYAFVNSL